MALRTVICDLLGVDHPVLLAGMGGVSYAEVCAAVSDAGGFGSLGMAGLPPKFIADQMAATGRYAAVLCLGAIIRGETTHDQHIARAVGGGIEAIGRTRGLPVLFGVLTCDTLAQALARAGGDAATGYAGCGNKGAECASAAIEMISLVGLLPGRAGS